MTIDQNSMTDHNDQADHCYMYSPHIESYIKNLVQLAFGSKPESGKISKKDQVGSPSLGYMNWRIDHESYQGNLEQIDLVLG